MNEMKANSNDYQLKLNKYNLSLYARVIEGNYAKRPVISMNCNTKDYSFLYNIGKDLYSKGDISKYEIAVFYNNKYIWSIRPDKFNFEGNIKENNFEKQIYEEIIYRENNHLTPIELSYDKSHNDLWNDAFKELMIDLKKENYKSGDELEKYLYSCVSESNENTQNNLFVNTEKDEEISLENDIEY